MRHYFMNTRLTIYMLMIGLVLFMSVTAIATTDSVQTKAEVRLQEVWVRPGIQGGNSAIYFKLTNVGNDTLTLVDAASSTARMTEVHETTHEHDDHSEHGHIMHMHHLPEIEIAPGELVSFKPGGMHVMLMDLKEPLSIGDRIQFSLIFGDHLPVQAEAVVKIASD